MAEHEVGTEGETALEERQRASVFRERFTSYKLVDLLCSPAVLCHIKNKKNAGNAVDGTRAEGGLTLAPAATIRYRRQPPNGVKKKRAPNDVPLDQRSPATSEFSMASVGMSTVDRSKAQKRTLFFFFFFLVPAADVTPDFPPPPAAAATPEVRTVSPGSVAARSSCLIAHASVATIAVSSDSKCLTASMGTAERDEGESPPKAFACCMDEQGGDTRWGGIVQEKMDRVTRGESTSSRPCFNRFNRPST